MKKLINRILTITLKILFRLFPRLHEKFPAILQVRKVREILTRERLNAFLKKQPLVQLDADLDKNAFNTLQHNIDGLMQSAEIDRTSWMLGPILSIEKVFKNTKNQKILSIGPRSEMEIFYYHGQRF